MPRLGQGKLLIQGHTSLKLQSLIPELTLDHFTILSFRSFGLINCTMGNLGLLKQYADDAVRSVGYPSRQRLLFALKISLINLGVLL